MSANNEFSWIPYNPDVDVSKLNSMDDSHPSTTNVMKKPSESIEAVTLKGIVLNIRAKYSYKHLSDFIDELMSANTHIPSNENGQSVSTLHQYTLISTREPIDMSNQSIRETYRPNLYIRKNDAFGPWNFNFLLNLLEIDYQIDEPNQTIFPKVWKTNSATKVRINRQQKESNEESTTIDTEETDVTLEGLLKKICEQNKCDGSEAKLWLRTLK
ncbi:unnamed protein product, partial [Rotaria magnacalcarata]